MFLSAATFIFCYIDTVMIAAVQSPVHSSVSQTIIQFLGRTVAEIKIKLFLKLTDGAKLYPISFWKQKHKDYTMKYSRST